MLSFAALLAVSFYADVLPILERRCLGCHQAGEAAPMPLGSYAEARPFAKAMRDAVLRESMPPGGGLPDAADPWLGTPEWHCVLPRRGRRAGAGAGCPPQFDGTCKGRWAGTMPHGKTGRRRPVGRTEASSASGASGRGGREVCLHERGARRLSVFSSVP